LILITVLTNAVDKSLQRCQSKITRIAFTNRLAFLYANVLESTQSCDDWVVHPAFKDCRELNPKYVSSWCGLDSHSLPFCWHISD